MRALPTPIRPLVQLSNANVGSALRKAAKHLKIPTRALLACSGGERTNVNGGADSSSSPVGGCGGRSSISGLNNSSVSGHSAEPGLAVRSSEPAPTFATASGSMPAAVREEECGAGRAQSAGVAAASSGEAAPPPALFQGCVVYFDGRTGLCMSVFVRVCSLRACVCERAYACIVHAEVWCTDRVSVRDSAWYRDKKSCFLKKNTAPLTTWVPFLHAFMHDFAWFSRMHALGDLWSACIR